MFLKPTRLFSIPTPLKAGIKRLITKKSFVVIFVILCLSCDEVAIPTEPQTIGSNTTYQISNNLKLYPCVEYIDGSLWEVVVYYYVGNYVVKTDSLSPVLTGEKSEIVKIQPTYEKIKYSFQLAPKKSLYYYGNANCRRYSQDFIPLEKGKNTLIEIHDLSAVKLGL